ncbi:MAG: hypothetical protein JWR50_871 [Mucilaginibacter sp.]|nr:hypothetical protein [Mucilaginibacter sp.]
MKTIILLISTLSAITYQGSKFVNNDYRINMVANNYNLKKNYKHMPDLHYINNGEAIQIKDSIRLNRFTQLPNDVQGCVCYFFLSKTDEIKKKYIMTEIFAQIAYVSINNKIQKFNLINFKDKVFYTYSNSDKTYTLRVEFKNKIKKDAEDFNVVGVLIIYKGQKVIIKRDIVGECGC